MDNETMKPLSMPDSHRLTELRKRKIELEGKRRNLYLQYINSKIDSETYHAQYRECDESIREIIKDMKDIRG